MLWFALALCLLTSLPAAAAPPAGVDLDDLDTWETRAGRALDGPPGCWDLSGDLIVAYTAYTAPSLFRRASPEPTRMSGTFTGRIVDGTWSSFGYRLARPSEEGTELDIPVVPLTGRIDPDVSQRLDVPPPDEQRARSKVAVEGGGEDEALNLLHGTIEAIDPSTTTAWAEWREDDQAVRVVQDVPMHDGDRADTLVIATLFPSGAADATAVDVVFPRRIRRSEGLVRFGIYDAQMHLRNQHVGERLLPAKESVSLGVGALGFTVGYEQTLTYRTATPCPAP